MNVLRAYARNGMRPRPTDPRAPDLRISPCAPTYGSALRIQGTKNNWVHMIDTEVARLRRLRNTALRARAVAATLGSDSARRDSMFSRGAVNCWRIARFITGLLRGHPYLSYQRGPSEVRGIYDRVIAGLLGGFARYRGRSHLTFSDELRRVARELDDARALTWSSHLSDTLGRSLTQIRGLINELDAVARNESGSRPEAAPRVETRIGALREDPGRVAGSWPYLAI